MNAGKLSLLISMFLIIARGGLAAEEGLVDAGLVEAGLGERAAVPVFVAVDALPGTEKTLATLKTRRPDSIILRPEAGKRAEIPANATAVIAIRQANGATARIVNGRRGATSPRRLLLAVADALERAGEPFSLTVPHMPIYRLGWVPDDPDMARAAPADVPAILVEVPASGSAFLPVAAETLSGAGYADEDAHYLAFQFRGKLFAPGEETLVTLMIGVFGLVFFNLFFLSFAYGKKSEQHLRDFFRVWWLPFFYFTVTLLSLAAGQAIVSWLTKLTFGDPEGWTVIPARAFAGKLIFAFFFTSALVTFNQLIPFPKGGFIYGYIASIVCLVNIFVFSYLDFSLSVLFALIFGLAYALSHVRNATLQLGGLALLVVPFLPYFRELARGDAATLAPLYAAGFAWNARLALFIVPFQLFMTRLTHSIGVLKARRGVHIPLLPLVALVPAILFTGFLVLAPAWTQERPLPVLVSQTLERDRLSTDTRSDVGRAQFSVVADPGLATDPFLPQRAADVLEATVGVRNALGRIIVTVTAKAALAPQNLTLDVLSDETGAVLASSRDFERSPSGDRATFTLSDIGSEGVTIAFTAVSGRPLDLRLQSRTGRNPWGVTINDPAIAASYELTVRRDFRISEGGTVTEGEPK